MAIQFPDLQPTATSNSKDVLSKTVRLTSADFSTAGVASVKAILPAQASILRMDSWVKTAFAGGGAATPTIAIGIPGTPANFVGASNIAAGASSTFATFPAISNILQPYGLPQGPDISLLFTGQTTVGNPTSGEMYVTVYYVC